MLGDQNFRKDSIKKLSVSLKKEKGALKEKMETLKLQTTFESKQINVEMKKLQKDIKRFEKAEEIFKVRKEAREKSVAVLSEDATKIKRAPTMLEETASEIERKLRISIRKMLNQTQERNENIEKPDFGTKKAAIYGWNDVDFDKKEIQNIAKKIHKYSPFVKLFCDVALEAFDKNESKKIRRKNKEAELKNAKSITVKETKPLVKHRSDQMNGDGNKNIKTELENNELKGKNECEENNKDAKLSDFKSNISSMLQQSFSFTCPADDIETKVKANRSISALRFLPRSTKLLFRLHEIVVITFPGIDVAIDLSKSHFWCLW